MLTQTANGDSRLSFWLRVREFAVPPSMIETATARRHAGDWAGACAAAGIDVDLDLRSVARTHGRDLAARIRADLRHLAPDLLRWHMPRIAPDGLLRPGLTIALARYDAAGRDDGRLCTWWSGPRPPGRTPVSGSASRCGTDPVPSPAPADTRTPIPTGGSASTCTVTCGTRAGAMSCGSGPAPTLRRPPTALPRTRIRWIGAAGLRLCRRPVGGRGGDPAPRRGAADGTVAVRFGGRRGCCWTWPRTGTAPDRPPCGSRRRPRTGASPPCPVLPDAATWVLPDLDLIRAGSIEADRLHPLVASALAPGPRAGRSGLPRYPPAAGEPHLVECRGAQHRIGLVDGVLVPLDHDPAEIRREELLAALTGTPLPCLQAIDQAHRQPDCLAGVRERLDHGDTAGALAVVEGLLGPDARAARRRAAGRTGGGRAAPDHLRALPGRPGRPRARPPPPGPPSSP